MAPLKYNMVPGSVPFPFIYMPTLWPIFNLDSSGLRMVKLKGLQAPNLQFYVATPFWRSAAFSLLCQVAKDT
jgi:hypothetical protein